MSFLLFQFNTTVQSVSFQTKSTKLATRLIDGRRQILWTEIMDGRLWRTKYGRQIMEVKLWTKIMMANYGGLLWRTIYRGQLWKLNYG